MSRSGSWNRWRGVAQIVEIPMEEFSAGGSRNMQKAREGGAAREIFGIGLDSDYG